MPTKSYIWGTILGIGMILEGFATILISQNLSPLHYALIGEYEIVDKLLHTFKPYVLPMGGLNICTAHKCWTIASRDFYRK